MSAMATEAQALVEPPVSEAPTPVAAPVTAPQQPLPDAADGAPAGKSKAKDSKSKDAKGKKDKSKKDKDGKVSAGKGAGAEDSGSPSVAGHPRAARTVAQAKGWGGLAGFFIAGYLSLPTGTLAQAALRALIAGCVCYVAAWAGAVFLWRRLVMLEIKGREEALLAGAHAALGPGETQGAPAEPPRAGAASPGR
jgi:hypothetical protein